MLNWSNCPFRQINMITYHTLNKSSVDIVSTLSLSSISQEMRTPSLYGILTTTLKRMYMILMNNIKLSGTCMVFHRSLLLQGYSCQIKDVESKLLILLERYLMLSLSIKILNLTLIQVTGSMAPITTGLFSESFLFYHLVI